MENVSSIKRLKIKRINVIQNEDVYDIKVNKNNNFFANTILVHNCGEQALPANSACVLGSINLSEFVFLDEETNKYGFDIIKFIQQIYRSSYYLDLIPDASAFPIASITETVTRTRPIGLGVMGLADVFIKLGITYGDEKSIGLTNIISDILGGTAIYSNTLRANIKSPFYDNKLIETLFTDSGYVDVKDQEIEQLFEILTNNDIPKSWNNMINSLLITINIIEENQTADLTDIVGKYKNELNTFAKNITKGNVRNSRMLSIAPTGTISMILDTSSSIEPIFAYTWNRIITNDKDNHENVIFYHKLLSVDDITKLQNNSKLDDKWIIANNLDIDSHIMPVKIFSKIVDAGISKTVNLSFDASIEDVKKVYEICYENNIKGITIYRDKSRDSQPIVNLAEDNKDKPNKITEVKQEENYVGPVRKRTNLVVGLTEKSSTPFGSMYLTANYINNEIFECFINLGKSGSEIRSMIEALSRIISIGLRSGTKIEDYISTLDGISGSETWVYDTADGREVYVRSIPDMIAKMLANLNTQNIELNDTHIKENVKKSIKSVSHNNDFKCPECGSPNFRMESSCYMCPSCGYSACK